MGPATVDQEVVELFAGRGGGGLEDGEGFFACRGRGEGRLRVISLFVIRCFPAPLEPFSIISSCKRCDPGDQGLGGVRAEGAVLVLRETRRRGG